MYHHGGWKDVTKFTDGCDLAHRTYVHLLRWIDVVEDSHSAGTKAGLLRPGRMLLQVQTDF